MKFVSHSMNRIAERTKGQVQQIRKVIPEAKCIIDIGANVGIFTLYFRKFFPAAIIYSFEPVPDNFKVLEENILTNKLESIYYFQSAVGVNHVPIKLGLPYKTDNVGLYSTYQEGYGIIEANTCVLSDVVKMKPDIIKIDVEGMEEIIIRGNKDIFEQAKVIHVEMNKSYSKQNYALKDCLIGLGFKYHMNTSKNDELWIKC